jgi:hypothetical protein
MASFTYLSTHKFDLEIEKAEIFRVFTFYFESEINTYKYTGYNLKKLILGMFQANVQRLFASCVHLGQQEGRPGQGDQKVSSGNIYFCRFFIGENW